MSAITVIYNLDGRPARRADAERMLERLRHRGDDGEGVWLGGDIALGHRMRYVTPESLVERLPMRDAESSAVITCDARIDNRAELIAQLSFSNKPVGEITDAEIILKAFEKWGEDCPAHLIGDFVFAVWDARRKKLFCARDPLGVKHFYYYHEPHKLFVLASEIKALLALDNVPCDLDEESVGDFLVINSEDKESTFYKNIKRLPATHALVVSRDDFRIRRYWQPSPSEIRLKNNAEYQEAFREKFNEAVACRLRSAYPVGSMLSGGLDSSAVVCSASNYLKANGRAPLKTFSAVFPTVAKIDSRIDELRYMQSVIEKSGCEPHFVNADDANPLQDIRKIMWHADHPIGHLNVYMDWEIYRAAQNQGVKVLLSGTDGDSTVSYGYEDFEQFVRRGNYVRLFKEALALKKNMPIRLHTLKRSIWHRGFRRAIPPTLLKTWRALNRRRPEDYAASPVMHPLHFNAVNPRFKAARDLENRIVKFTELNYPTDAAAAENHWNGLTGGLFSNMLEQLEKISAAFGIEARHPFFDRRLIEFCIGLPPGQRLYRGWTRSIFRFAMDGILPPDVQWRADKANIGAHIKINLLKYGSADLEKAINLDSRKLEKYVDTEAVRAAYGSYKSEPNCKDSEALLVLTNVYLSNWLEQTGFADSRPGQQPKSEKQLQVA